MEDYKKMYFALFHAVSEAVELLKKAQLDTEEMFIEADMAKQNGEAIQRVTWIASHLSQ